MRGRPGVPLERALSKLGAASRTDAHQLILDGRVRVNGRVVIDPLAHVIPEKTRIEIDDSRVARGETRVIAFHKPRGVVTTKRDPEGRRTVFDVLGDAADGLIAVGRLDRASTGLLLLTNDTQLAAALTDPARRVIRRYVVTVRGRVAPEDARALEQGVDIRGADGKRERLGAASVAIRKASGRETHLIVELLEGRNREIRRLFDAIGHEVTRLHRVKYGTIELGDLRPGEWREITDPERSTEAILQSFTPSLWK